jgi:hypothetical protein
MRWFSKQRVWFAVTFCSLVIFLLLLGSCATAPFSQKYVGSVFDSKTSSQTDQSFTTLWEKWTVQFGMTTRGGKPWGLSNLFSMGGGMGERGGPSEFPLHISATLMDSLLIEAGLQHYATLLTMAPEEQAEFRNAYYRRYDPTNHILIWCELRTTWTELFLDSNRWIIFIEDDAGNRYEPVQILEESQPIRQMVRDSLPGFQREQKRRGWEVHQKSLMLCFPKRDFYKNPILSERSQFLKLVFQASEDEKTRAEGTWVFKI